MQEWMTPEVTELDVQETQIHRGKTHAPDDVYYADLELWGGQMS